MARCRWSSGGVQCGMQSAQEGYCISHYRRAKAQLGQTSKGEVMAVPLQVMPTDQERAALREFMADRPAGVAEVAALYAKGLIRLVDNQPQLTHWGKYQIGRAI